MKKFSFRKKGLIKSSINNHQSSIGLGTKLRSLLLLVVAIMTCGEVWGIIG